MLYYKGGEGLCPSCKVVKFGGWGGKGLVQIVYKECCMLYYKGGNFVRGGGGRLCPSCKIQWGGLCPSC